MLGVLEKPLDKFVSTINILAVILAREDMILGRPLGCIGRHITSKIIEYLCSEGYAPNWKANNKGLTVTMTASTKAVGMASSKTGANFSARPTRS